MAVHDSESVKYTFDHIKSVWTLSAGGLAAALGLFAYIMKEAHFTSEVNRLFGFGSLAAVLLFIMSIWLGVTAQKKLINEVSESEKEPRLEVSDKLVLLNMLGRWAFFSGCIAIATTSIFFLFVSVSKRSEGRVTISLKNARVLTKEAKKFGVEDLDVSIPDSAFTLDKAKPIEIRDVVFKELDEKR